MKAYQDLLEDLKKLRSALVAYSGGVDSTLLLRAVKDSDIEVTAVTVVSEFITDREATMASKTAQEIGVEHHLETVSLLDHPMIKNNPKDRCYHCKHLIMKRLKEISQKKGLHTVIEGSNLSDLTGYRPGKRALTELGIKSPLIEAGLSKEDIRSISRAIGLDSWDRPSQSCLATRFYYGTTLTKELLLMVKTAEDFLIEKGFDSVRVRTDGLYASVEVAPKQVELLKTIAEELTERLKAVGFRSVVIDPEGYRSGKLDDL